MSYSNDLAGKKIVLFPETVMLISGGALPAIIFMVWLFFAPPGSDTVRVALYSPG
jgi:hypothetical protein